MYLSLNISTQGKLLLLVSAVFLVFVFLNANIRKSIKMLSSQGEEEGAGAWRAVEEAGGAEAQQHHSSTEQQPRAPECPEQQQQQQQ